MGSHLTKALSSQNYAVKIVSRMPGPQNVSWHEIGARGLPENTVAVVNLAGNCGWLSPDKPQFISP